jgi:hypothetical protein
VLAEAPNAGVVVGFTGIPNEKKVLLGAALVPKGLGVPKGTEDDGAAAAVAVPNVEAGALVPNAGVAEPKAGVVVVVVGGVDVGVVPNVKGGEVAVVGGGGAGADEVAAEVNTVAKGEVVCEGF